MSAYQTCRHTQTDNGQTGNFSTGVSSCSQLLSLWTELAVTSLKGSAQKVNRRYECSEQSRSLSPESMQVNGGRTLHGRSLCQKADTQACWANFHAEMLREILVCCHSAIACMSDAIVSTTSHHCVRYCSTSHHSHVLIARCACTLCLKASTVAVCTLA